MKLLKTRTRMIKDVTYKNTISPLVSVIVPIFNQEDIVIENLFAIKKSMSLPWELIILDDASFDNSLNRIIEWIDLDKYDSKCLTRVRVYKNSSEMFETHCDIFGFNVATGDYLLEIQIDIKINEKNFDSKLVNAILAHPDILMLSGRGTHKLIDVGKEYSRSSNSNKSFYFNLKFLFFWLLKRLVRSSRRFFVSNVANSPNKELGDKGLTTRRLASDESVVFPSTEDFIDSGVAGMVASLIDYECSAENLLSGRIWLSETVMRGPLLISRAKYQELGGLDGRGFFLGNDDHDLAYRAWKDMNWRTGFVPVSFESPSKDGSSRKEKKLSTMVRFLLLRYLTSKQRKKTGLYDFSRKIDIIFPEPQIRKFVHLNSNFQVNNNP